MKKTFLYTAILLTVLGAVFLIFALSHPELSFPWSNKITYILYSLYLTIIIFLFIMSFVGDKLSALNLITLILEMCSVFFLFNSMFLTLIVHESNWYLPVSLLFLIPALAINSIAVKLRKNKSKK